MKENPLSKLARSDYYQFLYKEYLKGRIKLFQNETDLTNLQIEFLKWLEVFKVIIDDINEGEDFAFKEILNDPLRVQAYIVFKSRKILRKKNKIFNKQDENKQLKERIVFVR